MTSLSLERLSAPGLLSLLRLTSPGLPVGGFAWSQGLEWAVQASWVKDENSAGEWIAGLIEHAQPLLEIPCLARCWRAWRVGAEDEALDWGARLYLARECSEARAEERAMGMALARLLENAGEPRAARCRQAAFPSYLCCFALAATSWDIPLAETCLGYLWAFAESQTVAAMKLVPLGQTAGQRILERALRVIPRAVEQGLLVQDEDIASAAFGQSLAMGLHETQGVRLFRS
jgi:urease accessory protein